MVTTFGRARILALPVETRAFRLALKKRCRDALPRICRRKYLRSLQESSHSIRYVRYSASADFHFIILYISRIIGDILLFIPAFPAILAAAGKSFKIPVDPKFFGMGSVHGNNFRLYFYLFSGTSRERRTAAVSMISKGVPLRMTAFAVWLYAT